MNILKKLILIVMIIGSINWGLIGLFDLNLVTSIFGIDTIGTKIVYVLVGISGIIGISFLFNDNDHYD